MFSYVAVAQTRGKCALDPDICGMGPLSGMVERVVFQLAGTIRVARKSLQTQRSVLGILVLVGSPPTVKPG